MNREKHGDKGTRLYTIWCNMKARCNNKKNPVYGGKGISVCNEWANSYTVFKDWAIAEGYNDTLTIDRINSNLNYEPSNCRWVGRKIQNNNTRRNIIVDGTTLTLKCEELGINPKLIQERMRVQGIPFNKAIALPLNFRHHKILFEGKVYSLKQLSKLLGLNYDTVYKRVKKYGWELSRALEGNAGEWLLGKLNG